MTMLSRVVQHLGLVDASEREEAAAKDLELRIVEATFDSGPLQLRLSESTDGAVRVAKFRDEQKAKSGAASAAAGARAGHVELPDADDDDSEFGENASVREADLLKQHSAVRESADPDPLKLRAFEASALAFTVTACAPMADCRGCRGARGRR